MANEQSLSLIELTLAQQRAEALLKAIEAEHVIVAGKTEVEIDRDIYEIAKRDFGVEQHWHKPVVRCGGNTLLSTQKEVPVLAVGDDDMVFIDLGPVFGTWEADVGQSYAIGRDPEKQRMCRDLPIVFDQISAHCEENPSITSSDLFAFCCAAADRLGWRFSGDIAGHIVGEFGQARASGDFKNFLIWPKNELPMDTPDEFGNPQHWIIEVKMSSKDDRFAGFYERLLKTAAL